MVILLILAVGLTVGLAVISRSVSDISTSTTSAESGRALAAAEAGIESALAGNATTNVVVPVTTAGSYTVTQLAHTGGGTTVTFPDGIKGGEVNTLFLVPHVTNISDPKYGWMDLTAPSYTWIAVTVCWGENVASGPTVPALEAIMYYLGPAGDYFVSRGIYDPLSRTTYNAGQASTAIDATAADCGDGKTYAFSKFIDFHNPVASGGLDIDAGGTSGSYKALYLRLKLLYNLDTPYSMAVRSGNGSDFPAQGRLVTALGTAGQTNRRVEVFERYPDPLPYYDSSVFSGSSLQK